MTHRPVIDKKKRHAEYVKQWRLKNPEKAKEISKRYRIKNKVKIDAKKSKWGRTYREKWRSIMIDALGGKCVRCGFSDERALQIDHVNGGGRSEHRKYSPSIFCKKVITEAKSGKYQILCANCNWIKKSEKGEVGK